VEQDPLDALRADAAVGEGVDPWDTGFVDLAGAQRVTWETARPPGPQARS
jgi:hypothetical protein